MNTVLFVGIDALRILLSITSIILNVAIIILCIKVFIKVMKY